MGASENSPTHAAAACLTQKSERRQAESLSRHWLGLVLEELDYGVLLLNEAGRVLHCNLAARRDLRSGHPLMLTGNQLHCRMLKDTQAMADALQAAERQGRRCLLRLGDSEDAANVVVVPLNQGVSKAAVLLVLARGELYAELCGEPATQWFALQHGLTPTETEVLKALSAGARPSDVAEQQGVAISTVRSQIQSIRAKSGTDSIAELLHQLAVLPPLRPCAWR